MLKGVKVHLNGCGAGGAAGVTDFFFVFPAIYICGARAGAAGDTVRMNKAILTNLLDLPINQADADNIFTVGMDWIGSVGYIFAVKKMSDVYIARSLSTLKMPIYLDDLPSFKETLDCLYAWRNHHSTLKEITLPALRTREQDDLFSSILGTSISGDVSLPPNILPNIYLTPSKRRQSQASTIVDLNSEESEIDE